MSMVNVSIVGNLARSPEQICFASGRVKTILVLAVNSNFAASKNALKKNNESSGKQETNPADFYRVEIWGKLAELAQKYLNKGNQVGVSGKLIMEHWRDREGNERLTPVVSATQLSFPPKMSRSASGSSSSSRNSAQENDSDSESESDEEDDAADLFAGARAVTVAEPLPHPYRPERARLHAVRS